MKGRKKTKLLALIVAVIMCVFVSIPAMADSTSTTYTAIPGTTFEFQKYLVVRAGETNPAVTFSFAKSIPANDVGATDTTLDVKKGVDPDDVAVGTAQFAAGAASTAKGTTDLTPLFTDYTYGVVDVTVDFTAVSFAEPGVYRYYITENNNNPSFGIDTTPTRTIDVYIIDNNGALAVGGYVMYEGEITAAPKKEATDPGETPNGAEAGTKSSMFVNTYPTNSLTITKTVTGNQGSKDKYFKFTVLIGDVDLVDTAHYAITGHDKNPVNNDATTYSDSELAENNKDYLTGAQLEAGYAIYLQNGDSVSIAGLPIGCKYTITETKEEYSVSTVTTRDAAPTTTVASGTSNVVTESNFTENTTVAYTNEKTGAIPTGVILSVAGLLVVGVVAIIGFVFFGVHSRRRYEED